MHIAIAESTDFETVHQIMKSAANRIKATGSSQWAHVLQNKEADNLKQHIEAREVYVGKIENEIISFCYLSVTPSDWDQQLWKDIFAPKVSSIYYLHKLALKQGWTGQGVADMFLKALQNKLTQEDILRCVIRLDCMAEKKVLTHLYERNGFDCISRIEHVQVASNVAPFNIYEWYSS